MGEASDGRLCLFVSCNEADTAGAERVGAVLEAAGYGVLVSGRDAEGDLVTLTAEAQRRSARTIALLSDHYPGSDFTAGERTARHARDAAGRNDTLIPVIVGPLGQRGLLDALIHADLLACGPGEGPPAAPGARRARRRARLRAQEAGAGAQPRLPRPRRGAGAVSAGRIAWHSV